MNLINLKYFCDAIRMGGLSAAAKANFVTQSAISQGITKLEKSLGLTLLAHHPNRLRPTPQGLTVFNEGSELLKRAEQFKQNLSQDKPCLLGNLEFACSPSFALAVIPPYLKRFREEHPEIKVNFHQAQNEAILQMLKNGSIDFGILPLEICRNQQCQVYQEDLDRYAKRTIYWGSFEFYAQGEQKDFILSPPQNKEMVFISEAYMKKYGKQLSAILQVDSWEIMASLVADGMGIGYLPDYIAKQHALTPCDLGLERQEYRISAISPIGMKLRKSSEIFLSYF